MLFFQYVTCELCPSTFLEQILISKSHRLIIYISKDVTVHVARGFSAHQSCAQEESMEGMKVFFSSIICTIEIPIDVSLACRSRTKSRSWFVQRFFFLTILQTLCAITTSSLVIYTRAHVGAQACTEFFKRPSSSNERARKEKSVMLWIVDVPSQCLKRNEGK